MFPITMLTTLNTLQYHLLNSTSNVVHCMPTQYCYDSLTLNHSLDGVTILNNLIVLQMSVVRCCGTVGMFVIGCFDTVGISVFCCCGTV